MSLISSNSFIAQLLPCSWEEGQEGGRGRVLAHDLSCAFGDRRRAGDVPVSGPHNSEGLYDWDRRRLLRSVFEKALPTPVHNLVSLNGSRNMVPGKNLFFFPSW